MKPLSSKIALLPASWIALSIPGTGFAQAQTQEEAAEPEYLETTTLVSTRTARSELESPASVVSINLNSDESELGEDIGDIVSETPGVSIPFDYRGLDAMVPYMNGGYMSFNIRGVDGNRVLLEIDGIRQVPEYNEYVGGMTGGTTRSMFDPKVFESVDILKGSASALYGSDALGGVLSMKTASLTDYLERSERPWYLSTSFGYYGVSQQFNQVTKAGVRTGDFYITLVNSYRNGSEQQNDKGVDPYPEDNTSDHLLTNVTYVINKENRLTLTAERYASKSDTDMTGISSTMSMGKYLYTLDYSDDASSRADLQRERVSLKYENKPEDGFLWDSFSALAYYQSTETNLTTRTVGTVGYPADSLYPGYKPATRNRKDAMDFAHDATGLNLLAQKKMEAGSTTHTVIAGADLSTEYAENDFLRYDYGTTSTTVTDKMNLDPSRVNRFDFFAQDEIDWKSWLLVGGMRYSHYEIKPDNDEDYLDVNGDVQPAEDYSNDTLTPSLSLLYKLTEDSVLWGRYARGIKNPTAENYTGAFSHSGGSDPFIIIANPDLDPETSDAFEIGYRKYTKIYKFDVSAHKTFYKDFIDSSVLIEDNEAPDADIYSHANIGEVEIWGAEANFGLDLNALHPILEGFSINLGTAWTEGKNKTDDEYLASVAPFEVVSKLAYNHNDKWGCSLTGTFRAKKSHADDMEAQGYTVPDSSIVLDTYAWAKLTDNIRIRGGVNNLTDETYWTWTNISQSGGHSGGGNARSVQPGINAYVAVDFVF